jgi:hypothetical protein
VSGSWEVAVSLSDIRSDDPELAEPLRIEERELEAGAPSGNVGQRE